MSIDHQTIDTTSKSGKFKVDISDMFKLSCSKQKTV